MNMRWDLQVNWDHMYGAYLIGRGMAVLTLCRKFKTQIVETGSFHLHGLTLEEFWEGAEKAPGLLEELRQFLVTNKDKFYLIPKCHWEDEMPTYHFGSSFQAVLNKLDYINEKEK